MKSDRWFEDTAETISQVVGLKCIDQSWVGWVSEEAMGLDALSFGFRLRLLKAPDAVAVEVTRMKLGVPLGPVEEEIALALPDEMRRVEDLLDSHSVPADAEEGVLRLWHYVVLCQARQRWATDGEPQLEFKEIEEQWGSIEPSWSLLNTKGFDSFYFGRGARARFLKRVDSYLAEEKKRWKSPQTSQDFHSRGTAEGFRDY